MGVQQDSVKLFVKSSSIGVMLMTNEHLGRFNFSVFAVVSCLVYLIETIESIPLIAQTVSFPIMIDGKESQIDIPLIWIPVTIFHTIIAARLYAHAWAVDESRYLWMPKNRNSSAVIKLLFVFEWLLRVVWVALASYLPNIYRKIVLGTPTIVGGTLEWYYLYTFGALIVWDLMMYKTITNSSTKFAFVNQGNNDRQYRISLLKRRWIGYDFCLFFLSLCMCGFGAKWNNTWLNWKAPVYILILSIGTFICFTQMLIWIPEIINKKNIAISVDN